MGLSIFEMGSLKGITKLKFDNIKNETGIFEQK